MGITVVKNSGHTIVPLIPVNVPQKGSLKYLTIFPHISDFFTSNFSVPTDVPVVVMDILV